MRMSLRVVSPAIVLSCAMSAGMSSASAATPALARPALVTSVGGKRWVLPKGSIDDGEESREAAARETGMPLAYGEVVWS